MADNEGRDLQPSGGDVAGPFRRVVRAWESPAPQSFVCRRDERELLLETRWPLRGWAVVWRVAATVGMAAVVIAASSLGWFALAVAASGFLATLWRVLRRWERSTVRLTARECSVVRRTLAGTDTMRKPLAIVEFVGVGDIDPGSLEPTAEEGAVAQALAVTVGGDQLIVFRGLPRDDLIWAAAELNAWKEARAASEY